MQHSNTIKNHAAQSLRGVEHINITDIYKYETKRKNTTYK